MNTNPTLKKMGAIVIALFVIALITVFKYEDVTNPITSPANMKSGIDFIKAKNLDNSQQIIAEMRRDISLLNDKVSALEEKPGENTDSDKANIQDIEISHITSNKERLNEPEESITELKEQRKAALLVHYKNLDNYIGSEEQDPNWSVRAENIIYNALEDTELSGSQFVNVDCRTSLCRAEVYHNSLQDMETFKLEIIHKVGSQLPKASMQHSQLDDGRQKTILYLVKDGHDFPLIEQ
ncbi:hypothetical protein MNBD_GAMMA23-1935 [hydrothermal vent metagenome]|uniref:Uncharacterized protein n=1 Tax=hydrothermal vent metagenome TaxID=652676 RepID=A0A3B1AHD9_9ZZZZ